MDGVSRLLNLHVEPYDTKCIENVSLMKSAVAESATMYTRAKNTMNIQALLNIVLKLNSG